MIAYFYGVRPGRRSGRYPFEVGYRYAGWDTKTPASPWSSKRNPLCEGASLVAAWGPGHRLRANDPEGVPVFCRRDGWTLVAMWDRSADPRGGSHATFALGADLSDAEALDAARHAFPEVFARIEAHLGRKVAP